MLNSAWLIVLIFPIIINQLGELWPSSRGRSWVFVAPLALAVITGWIFLEQEPWQVLFFQLGPYLTAGFRIDGLSGLMSTTVMLIGASVMKYSVRYLQDDPNKKRFDRHLAATLTFVLLMLNSINLLFFWFAWVGTSYFLHQLLLHFEEREGAQIAAQQKYWVSRLGDVFLIVACGALFVVHGSVDFDVILDRSLHALIPDQDLFWLYMAAICLVLGAMTKSAQFPFHYWLPKTMETPTPVSALMHAGIINAGGFLVVRLAPFLEQVPLSLSLLALVGGFTAVYGSIVMFSQTSAKKFLAYSTISQMGFMMLQCGLGCFSVAVMHIVGHAFYKAYSFLGAGAMTDYGKLNRYLGRLREDPPLIKTIFVALVTVGFTLFTGPFVGYGADKPGALVLCVVLGLALAQIFISFESFKRAIGLMALLWGGYFVLYHGFSRLLRSEDGAPSWTPDALQQAIGWLVILAFVLLYIAQNNLNRISQTRFGRKMYVKSLNGGFYAK